MAGSVFAFVFLELFSRLSWGHCATESAERLARYLLSQGGESSRIEKILETLYPRLFDDPDVVTLVETLQNLRKVRSQAGVRQVFSTDDPGLPFSVKGTLFQDAATLEVGISQVVRENIPANELNRLPRKEPYLGYAPQSIDPARSFAKTVVAVLRFSDQQFQKFPKMKKIRIVAKGVLNTRVIGSLRDLGFVPVPEHPLLADWIKRGAPVEDLERIRSQVPLFATHWELMLARPAR